MVAVVEINGFRLVLIKRGDTYYFIKKSKERTECLLNFGTSKVQAEYDFKTECLCAEAGK